MNIEEFNDEFKKDEKFIEETVKKLLKIIPSQFETKLDDDEELNISKTLYVMCEFVSEVLSVMIKSGIAIDLNLLFNIIKESIKIKEIKNEQ